MGPKRSNNCVTTGKERLDRVQETKHQFDPLEVEIKYPGTAILLLKCQEKSVLLAAAAALAKFSSKSQENLEVLFDLELVDNVIPLITHEDLFTRRFAGKLLAEMVAVENVRNFLLESQYYISYFTKVLVNETDTFMQEFSSFILAELSKDMYGAAHLLELCPDMDFLFDRLACPDPDVKRNTVQIIYHLLQDPLGANKIIETKNFKMEPLYELFNSPYFEIQKLALDVVCDFVCRNRDDRLQDLFRQSNGLKALLAFLDNVEWENLHVDALKILALAGDNPKTVETLDNIGGIQQILSYIGDTPNSMLFMQALNVAVRLSHTSRGRQALYKYGIIDYLLRALKGNVLPDTYEISCRGIGMMTLYNEAAKELTENNCMENILDVLKNENLKWSARHAALFALNQLVQCDPKNCQDFLNIQEQSYLLWLMKQETGLVPVEIRIESAKCFGTIARNQPLCSREAIINTEVVDALCASFELKCASMDEFKIACCNTLALMCAEMIGRRKFLNVSGQKKLYNLLCDTRSIPIRNAAAQLIQSLCTDPIMADAFVSVGYLNYMMKNRSTARIVPSWDTCIDALLNSHLPMKFAFTGRLSLHDVTRDGFYVLKRNVCKFPLLADIFRFNFSPLEPLYVVNCAKPHRSIFDSDSPDRLSLDESDQQNIQKLKPRDVFLSTTIIRLTADARHTGLQWDSCLHDFIELFKCTLIAAESKTEVLKTTQGLVNVGYVISRAKMLAKFVVRQMSGPDPLIKCLHHQLEIHLKEIKKTIETSVIPLGMLRVGSYFERALLFKVIADRIHLPAALVRGEYGRGWVEIAVPKVTPVEEDSFHSYIYKDQSQPEMVTIRSPDRCYEIARKIEEDPCKSIFPTKLMKPNYIVDLMDSPGELIPIGSRQAKLYCEKRLLCDNAGCDADSQY